MLALFGKSSRIREDLSRAVNFGREHFCTSIVLREWCEEGVRTPQGEFRAFVHDKKITALTQYFSFLLFPQLVREKETYLRRIIEFHDSVKAKLPHQHYVFDVLVLRDRVLLIELNPFANSAGAGLFSWGKDRERFLGQLPFEFRLLELPDPTAFDALCSGWKKFLKEKYTFGPHPLAPPLAAAADGCTELRKPSRKSSSSLRHILVIVAFAVLLNAALYVWRREHALSALLRLLRSWR